jgi:hypothetical protein
VVLVPRLNDRAMKHCCSVDSCTVVWPGHQVVVSLADALVVAVMPRPLNRISTKGYLNPASLVVGHQTNHIFLGCGVQLSQDFEGINQAKCFPEPGLEEIAESKK